MLTRVCTKCSVEKSIDCFNKQKLGKHGVRSVCKSCNAENYEANKEVILRNRKQNYKLNKEVVLQQTRLYRDANKELVALRQKYWYESNKQSVASKNKYWRETNQFKHNEHNAHRRATKLQATPSWVDRKAVAGMYQLAVLFNETGINLHVDHIVPLNSDLVCGLHCESNLQLLPASDNISKGNRWWPDMW